MSEKEVENNPYLRRILGLKDVDTSNDDSRHY